jgi:hypothetical protein
MILRDGGPAADAVALSPVMARKAPQKCAAADKDWQWRLSRDRPVYGCPKCGRSAMQFYALFPGDPPRREVFRCHACETCWDV